MKRSQIIKDVFKNVKDPFQEYWRTNFLSLVSNDCLSELLKCPSVNGFIDLTALQPEYANEIEKLYSNTKKEFEALN